jgi:hypothetical protein
VTGCTHDSTRDTASVALKETKTARLYQPAAFGARSGLAPTTGAVASYLREWDLVAMFPAQSRQVPVTEAVSLSGPL